MINEVEVRAALERRWLRKMENLIIDIGKLCDEFDQSGDQYLLGLGAALEMTAQVIKESLEPEEKA